MHRTRHSESVAEQTTNFGTGFSFWNRLFDTYLAEPAACAALQCGLVEVEKGSRLNILTLLMLPFRPEPNLSPSLPIRKS
jgi:hypothetical protein